jgi:hypothetical protein
MVAIQGLASAALVAKSIADRAMPCSLLRQLGNDAIIRRRKAKSPVRSTFPPSTMPTVTNFDNAVALGISGR